MEIIKDVRNTPFDGCDAVVRIDGYRPIRLLQITDMQIIDSAQSRTPDRLRGDEISAWRAENFDALCGDHIRSLVTQTSPDLIFITGDITYGSFDDTGSTFRWICALMDSFGIPWAPVFGNHDNESRMGVSWQCAQLENSQYCLFRRGTVSGNGNYTVGIAVRDTLVRVLYMLDSNGCAESTEDAVIKKRGIYPDQIDLVRSRAARISASQKKSVPAFMAFHIPVDCFIAAETAKGYCTDDRVRYTLGVDVPTRDGDFGCKQENARKGAIRTGEGFLDFLKSCHVDGVFVGHCHKINTCITYDGIRWVYGLKTGQYDYHSLGQLGGTLVTLCDSNFDVCHVPALVPYGVYPEKAPMFHGMFAREERGDFGLASSS